MVLDTPKRMYSQDNVNIDALECLVEKLEAEHNDAKNNLLAEIENFKKTTNALSQNINSMDDVRKLMYYVREECEHKLANLESDEIRFSLIKLRVMLDLEAAKRKTKSASSI